VSEPPSVSTILFPFGYGGPGDGDVEFGEAGVDEHWGVGAEREVDADVVVGDGDGAGVVQEVSPEPVGGGEFVAGQFAGERRQLRTVGRRGRRDCDLRIGRVCSTVGCLAW
jgi:hypothetical protein